jgi:hypothetical protein
MRGAPDVVADWVVVLSANHPDQVEQAQAACLDAAALREHGGTAPEIGTYRLLFALDG